MWTISLRHVGGGCILGAICVLSCGCNKRLPTRVVYGSVKVGDQAPDNGYVRFVPIEGTPGPASNAGISGGQYRIEVRGGVPLGKHRVEVFAQRKTGRKVLRDDVQVEEFERLGPEHYASAKSPVTVEVTSQSDGRIDIQIPTK
jgi:hypothetical protein